MKVSMVHTVAMMAYWTRLDALFYFLNRRAKRIVTFHNVIPVSLLSPGDENLICFSDALFMRIVDEIRSRFRFSNDLEDPKTCTLTFDDGYLNQLEVAGRILREKRIPAILFLAQDLLDADRPLIVDQCLAWMEKVPMKVAEECFQRQFADRVQLWQLAVRPLFVGDGANRGRRALDKLNAVWPIDQALASFPAAFRRLRYTGISRTQVEEFKRDGWVFGHHTYSHFPVKDLSADDARAEMTPPKDMKQVVFSYPYGDGGSVSVRDVSLAKELGYQCAVANEVELTPLTGRYFRPRFMLTTDDKYLIHFQLSGLKYFLKYRRLLPTCAF